MNDPVAQRRISEGWTHAHRVLRERAASEFDRCAYTKTLPKNLYHFTDCEGLIGILKSKSLRASLATSLNDRSEMMQARNVVADLIKAGALTTKTLPLQRLDLALDKQSWRVYVISFCAHQDTASQWLHYGRSGLGVAIGFNSAAVERSPYRLCPVLYDKEQQLEWCKSLVTTVEEAVEEALSHIPTDKNRDLLIDIALELLATHVSMATPRMKNPVFSAEDEWRLIAYVPKATGIPLGDEPAGKTCFRASAGRIVPFKKLVFDVLPILEIVLGSSAPIQEDPLALKVLMEETLSNSDDVTVPISVVPVRP